MRRVFTFWGVVLAGLAVSAGSALAQTFNSGSTGVDGPFSPATSVTVNLPPSGIFNYTTVNIPTGVTVTFARNTANTPVTILASGNVTIAGTINVAGTVGGDIAGTTVVGNNAGLGGPGGFDGGAGSNGIVSTQGGTGGGPGGGTGGNPVGATAQSGGGGGSYGGTGTQGNSGAGPGLAYGNVQLLPLIGGSGGGGGGARFAGQTSGGTGAGGGGGGGAIVIASSQTITFTGSITARGGNGNGSVGGSPPPPGGGGGGSGGAVRLVATTIAGTGSINASGGSNGAAGGVGGAGRIRIEGFTTTGASFNFNAVTPSIAQPTSVALPNAPTLQISSVGGVASPATPSASFGNPDITLPAATTNPVTVQLAGGNIPPGTTVTVRVQGQRGAPTSTSTTLAGTQTATTAAASVTVPVDQPSIVSATASFTVLASVGGGPVFVQGEEVEQVRVSASFGGASQVVYVTKSGREIVAAAGR